MKATVQNLKLPSFDFVKEPTLLFHPDRMEDVDPHPLQGLVRFGPYSRAMPLSAPDPIRAAVICPDESFRAVAKLFTEFHRSHRPRERAKYLPDFSGFSKIFGVGFNAPPSERDDRVVLLRKEELDAALNGSEPHAKLAELCHSAIRRLTSIRRKFDVVFIYLPGTLAQAFQSPTSDETTDFDLHHSIKALCSSLRMPIQVLNDDALIYFCRCSVMWRLAIAVYAKSGGIPWKLAGFPERHAYVGLSYCIRKHSPRPFVTCCSQIFDARGTNLQFLLYESEDASHEGENPFLPRGEMRRVMARTLSLYQHQKGLPPTRLVVHKTTTFTSEEIDGCMDALGAVDDLELLTLTQETSWQGIKIEAPRNETAKKGEPAAYPIERGTVLPLSPFDYLLWTQGNCSEVTKGGGYFKEGKGIPHPLFVSRAIGSGSFFEGAREIVALTKMNWNNDYLYDKLPVTNKYASILADVVKRMGPLSSDPYDFRYFM
jgi:hypothetical protein